MSGNASAEAVVALPADADGVLRRLVAAVDIVVRADLPPHALVGGLAVMANLAKAHRVTADVDTVADDDADGIRHTVELLVHEAHAQAKVTGDGVIFSDGTKVDIIATGTWAAIDLPDDLAAGCHRGRRGASAGPRFEAYLCLARDRSRGRHQGVAADAGARIGRAHPRPAWATSFPDKHRAWPTGLTRAPATRVAWPGP